MLVVCNAAMIPLAWVIGMLKGVDGPWQLHVGIGVGMGTVFAAFLFWYSSRQARDFELSRLGDKAAIERRARENSVDPFARFALLLASGQLAEAEVLLKAKIEAQAILGKSIKAAVSDKLPGIATCRAALELARHGKSAASGVIEVIDLSEGRALFESPGSRAVLHVRAHLLATAAVVAETAGAERALRKLEDRKVAADPEVRAYAQWLRAKFDYPIGDAENVEDAERGAELARHAGHEEVAQMVERRATLLRAQRARHAYR